MQHQTSTNQSVCRVLQPQNITPTHPLLSHGSLTFPRKNVGFPYLLLLGPPQPALKETDSCLRNGAKLREERWQRPWHDARIFQAMYMREENQGEDDVISKKEKTLNLNNITS